MVKNVSNHQNDIKYGFSDPQKLGNHILHEALLQTVKKIISTEVDGSYFGFYTVTDLPALLQLASGIIVSFDLLPYTVPLMFIKAYTNDQCRSTVF